MNPQISANAGSVFWNVTAPSAAWDAPYWAFDKTGNLDVVLFGMVETQPGMSVTPNVAIILEWTANSTAGTKIAVIVSTKLVTAASTTVHFAPSSLTAETQINTTLSTTAWVRNEVTYPASGNLANTPAANDILIVAIKRMGSDTTNDTLSATTPALLFGGYLRCDTTL
jgi:hypothetical protein